MTNDELVVLGLDKNTEYKFKIEYDIKNSLGILTHGVTEDYYITTENFVFPVLEKFEETKLDKNSVSLQYDIDADIEDVITPDAPKEEKSGCKKDLSMLVVSLIGLSSLIILAKNKNKNKTK